jgi:predicted PurR-regulated permease PerM
VGLAMYELSGPAQRWISQAPETLSAAAAKVRDVLRPVLQVSRTAEQVTRAAGPAEASKTTEVVVQGPSLISQAFGTTQRLLAAVLEVVVLLYFLLATGDLFLQKLIKVLPNFREKKAAIQIARETEAAISTYLLTAAIVNVSEGLLVTGAMYLLGMPTPALWGAMVALLEFIPYLGAAAIVAILTAAGLTTFDSVGHALLAPAAFLTINIIQANVVSPLLLGERLSLNPVAIFVGLAFWFFVWGVPGAFLAVPILAAFKIFCDHVASLAAIGEFLGRRDEDERRTMVRPLET